MNELVNEQASAQAMESPYESNNRDLSYLELVKEADGLIGLDKRYYQYLPDKCWKSEHTQAAEMGISRRKLQGVKKRLIDKGLLKLELLPNGKRHNLKHLLWKTIPIRLQERDSSFFRFLPDDDLYINTINYTSSINWDLLQSYTAEDINQMTKLDKVELYMNCGFIVLPTHYPIFTDDGVQCSCYRGFKCPDKGKHPVHKYKFIDAFHYESMKAGYLKEFENNPDLNIGFKVMGYSVLDVDNREGGKESLARLTAQSEIDLTHSINTTCGDRGGHIYVTNLDLKNTAGQVGRGLDIRSENGFVVAPGSVHRTGAVYEWNHIGDVTTLPDDWFYSNDEEDSADNGSAEQRTSDGSGAAVKLKDIVLPKVLTRDYRIKEGTRELTLFKWAYSERGKGSNADDIFDALITIRDTYCDEGQNPVTDDEVRHLADSVAAAYPTNVEKRLRGH
jgi:hypothetical protein